MICVGTGFKELRRGFCEIETRVLHEDLLLLDPAVGVGG